MAGVPRLLGQDALLEPVDGLRLRAAGFFAVPARGFAGAASAAAGFAVFNPPAGLLRIKSRMRGAISERKREPLKTP